jgi:hypothetical protein
MYFCMKLQLNRIFCNAHITKPPNPRTKPLTSATSHSQCVHAARRRRR